jgi:hypothetical protein
MALAGFHNRSGRQQAADRYAFTPIVSAIVELLAMSVPARHPVSP